MRETTSSELDKLREKYYATWKGSLTSKRGKKKYEEARKAYYKLYRTLDNRSEKRKTHHKRRSKTHPVPSWLRNARANARASKLTDGYVATTLGLNLKSLQDEEGKDLLEVQRILLKCKRALKEYNK